MRRLGFILICLWVVANSFAVTYSTYRPTGTDFRSTSAYMAPNSTPDTVHHTPYTNQSLSAISASNFESLNSEGGACYIPSATKGGVRKGNKVTEPDTESVGEGVLESPIVDIPLIFFMILLSAYVIPHSMQKKREPLRDSFFSLYTLFRERKKEVVW